MDSVKLYDLDGDVLVCREDDSPITARELKSMWGDGTVNTSDYWAVAVPAVWTPDAETMIDDYIQNASDDMYEDADEVMRDQMMPFAEKIQELLSGVKVGYYDLAQRIVFP